MAEAAEVRRSKLDDAASMLTVGIGVTCQVAAVVTWVMNDPAIGTPDDGLILLGVGLALVRIGGKY